MSMYKLLLIVLIGMAVVIARHAWGNEKNMIYTATTIKEYKALFAIDVPTIEQKTNTYITELQNALYALCATQKPYTYATIFEEIDKIQSLSNVAVWQSLCSATEMTSCDQAIRDAAHAAVQKMGAAFIDLLSNNKQLYKLCKSYAENEMQHEALSEEQRFFVDYMMKQFKRAGLHLDDDLFAQVGILKKELVNLGLQFEFAIAQDSTVLFFKAEDLTGLPEEILATFTKNSDGLYQLGLDYPTVTNVMQLCTNADTRRKMLTAFNNRAYPANQKVLQELIAKRAEFAQMLGFASFADYDLADQMVLSVQVAQQFLDDLIKKCKVKVETEFDELKKIEHESVAWTADGKLMPFDLQFLQTLYKNRFYAVDEREIANYFPVEETVQALLGIYSDFLGLAFKTVLSEGFWHETVRVVQVFKQDSNQLLGTLLLDLFPRKGKYTHACHMTIIPTFMTADACQHPGLSVVLANFPASTAEKPALLMLDDVRTFFHEFGHALHALLGATFIPSLSGTNTKMDFVELPSQLLEEWLWDKAMLKRVSCHYQTGKPLPDALIDRIVSLKHFFAGYFVQRQAYLASLALAYYTQKPPVDLQGTMRDLFTTIITCVAYVKESHFYAAFGHLYGYGAKYYGYLWSKVFAQDLFETIKQEGLLNSTVGKRYTECILKPGGTKDPMGMMTQFLGRAPNSDAFFASMGLKNSRVRMDANA